MHYSTIQSISYHQSSTGRRGAPTKRIMANQDDSITEVVGYQKPEVVVYTLRGIFFDDYDLVDVGGGVDAHNILAGIVQNDPAIAGL